MVPNEHDAALEVAQDDVDLNENTNPFSSVHPPGGEELPWVRPSASPAAPSDPRPGPFDPRPGTSDPRPGTSDPRPGPFDPRPGTSDPRPGPFDPRTPAKLPPHGWYTQVPLMEPLPDPNVLPSARPAVAVSASNGAAVAVSASNGAAGSVAAAVVPPGYRNVEPPPALHVPPRRASVEPLTVRTPRERADETRETADSLTAEALLQGKRIPPGSGWRRTVYRVSGGIIRVGESSANLRRRDLINRVRTPVAGGHHRVAVMSLKGGVGKTTTTVGLGATLASLRGDRVIAVDANPDRGTLSDKVRLETSATVRDLLNERGQVSRYADVRAFTSQATSRLEVLASDRDPGVSVAFNAEDYQQVCKVLEHFYSICITDCGTGLLHSAMSGVLELSDHIILVSSPSVDGARSASATLDWLDAHDYGNLVRNGVVVLSAIRPRSKSSVDLDRLEQHFAARCRAVVRVPYDPHLEEGAEVELEQLSGETAEAYLNLAAIVGDGFAVPRRTAAPRPGVTASGVP